MRAGLILFSSLLVGLSGCSSLSGFDAQDQFGCKAMPEGTKCKSAREVYGLTETADQVTTPPRSEGSPSQGGAASQSPPTVAHGGGIQPAVLGDGYRPPVPAVDKPVPVRADAKVMRAWIAPWEDASGDLNVGGYVFMEIEGRRWSLGEEQVARVPVMAPLTPAQVSPRPVAKVGPRKRVVPQGELSEQAGSLPDGG